MPQNDRGDSSGPESNELLYTNCQTRKQRLLCLHSFRTSGEILAQQLFLFSNLGSVLIETCDLTYIDAPHRCSPADDEKLEPMIKQVFNGPYHEWFNAQQQANGGGLEYEYLFESLKAVEHAVRTRGPFDGFLGFSQGGTLAHLCCMLAAHGRLPFPEPSFLILLCSRASRHHVHRANSLESQGLQSTAQSTCMYLPRSGSTRAIRLTRICSITFRAQASRRSYARLR